MGDGEMTTEERVVSTDRVSDILKWILLFVAVVCFALLGWATVLTYDRAPPVPQAIVDPGGTVLMSRQDIVAGKGGFQKADLMDYGSIYGMGSYFGEDYTASTLVRLGVLTKQNLTAPQAPRPAPTRPPTSRSQRPAPPELPPQTDDAAAPSRRPRPLPTPRARR